MRVTKRKLKQLEKDLNLAGEMIEMETLMRQVMKIMSTGKAWVEDAINLFDSMWREYVKITWWYKQGNFKFTQQMINTFKESYQGVFIHFNMMKEK